MSDRKHIPAETKLRLFASAAGYCQHPHCLKPLFPVAMGGDKHIAEMAHMISHGKSGPRSEERLDEDEGVNSFENLILLCPTCHTIIDKEPGGYSRETLMSWKINHLSALTHKQGIRFYEERGELRNIVIAAFAENKAIWKKYAPSEGEAFDCNPEAEVAKLWDQRMRSVILPNHFLMQEIIKVNAGHLTETERETFALYQEHIRGLAERHICGIARGAIRYPVEMERIFE